MRDTKKWVLLMSLILCSAHLVQAQSTRLNHATLQVGLTAVNPEEFNSNIFPRLSSWGLDKEEINQMTSFSLLIHKQRNWLDYGFYGTYGLTAVRGEAEYFSTETVLSPSPAHVGETVLSVHRFALGMHIGTDLLNVFSKNEDLRFEWIIRARAGLGVSSIKGTVDRYSLLNRQTETEFNRTRSLLAESQIDTEITFKLSDRIRVGAFASLLYSGTANQSIGAITRRPKDSDSRVRVIYSGYTTGLLCRLKF